MTGNDGEYIYGEIEADMTRVYRDGAQPSVPLLASDKSP